MFISLSKKKYLRNIIYIWFGLFLIVLVIVWILTKKTLLTTLPNHFWSNYFQKVFGFYAYILLSIQIFLGAFRKNLQLKLGNWILEIHQLQGKIIYLIILFHTLAFLIYQYFGTGKLNPFYIYTDFCFICEDKTELFISLGRISFILLGFTILAALTRYNEFMKKNWLYLHMLNYFIFFAISTHAFFVGSDIRLFPAIIIYVSCNLLVLGVLVKKLLQLTKRFRLK